VKTTFISAAIVAAALILMLMPGGSVLAQQLPPEGAPPPVEEAEPAPPPPPPGEIEMPPEEVPLDQPPVVEEPEPMAPPPPGVKPSRPTPIRPRMTRPPMRIDNRRPGRVPNAGPGRGPNGGPGAAASAPTPPSENVPKTGGTPDAPVSFDFTDAPLTQVVESIARMTGKNFDIDPTIASTHVTIITHEPIPPEMAYEVLGSILGARGFALVPTLDGKLIRIVPWGESLDKVNIEKGREIAKDFDAIVTHIIKPEYADANELSGMMQALGSKTAQVVSYAPANTLIITDSADGVQRMLDFLKEVDIPGFETEMEMFTLEYARAEVIAGQIEEVLTGSAAARPGAAPQPGRPSTPVRIPARPNVPGASAPTVVGNKEETLRIVSDERLNSLIVVATNTLMERVRELVAKLDTPTPYEANNMNVYKLLNAPAEDVEEALNAILGTTPRTGAEKAPGQAGEIQPFEKKVVVTRYEQINALLILASPQDYKLIREIIAQLDVPQRQVLVEAVIMDVSLQDTFGLTVDAASVTGEDGFAIGNTSNINSLVNVTDLATGLTSGTAALLTAKNLLSLGANGGTTVGVFDTIEATVDGTPVKIPFVPFLIKALESLTDVDILSQPSLTTQDNEAADIIVGQELPVPTQRSGYSYNPNTGTPSQQQYPSYGLTSYGRGINREDVGVKMKVTPHINEGDYVSLETEIEVSEATQSDVGINANELGPTFNKTKVNNNVVVQDGSTGVIGGLIKETASHNRNQTPVLGDIPVLGFLFRSKNDVRKKQNVVVLITPFIVKEGVDLDRVSEYKVDQWKEANVDALFERGFIKRVKKGHYMRNYHRPSIVRGEKLEQEGTFGRGKIER